MGHTRSHTLPAPLRRRALLAERNPLYVGYFI